MVSIIGRKEEFNNELNIPRGFDENDKSHLIDDGATVHSRGDGGTSPLKKMALIAAFAGALSVGFVIGNNADAVKDSLGSTATAASEQVGTMSKGIGGTLESMSQGVVDFVTLKRIDWGNSVYASHTNKMDSGNTMAKRGIENALGKPLTPEHLQGEGGAKIPMHPNFQEIAELTIKDVFNNDPNIEKSIDDRFVQGILDSMNTGDKNGVSISSDGGNNKASFVSGPDSSSISHNGKVIATQKNTVDSNGNIQVSMKRDSSYVDVLENGTPALRVADDGNTFKSLTPDEVNERYQRMLVNHGNLQDKKAKLLSVQADFQERLDNGAILAERTLLREQIGIVQRNVDQLSADIDNSTAEIDRVESNPITRTMIEMPQEAPEVVGLRNNEPNVVGLREHNPEAPGEAELVLEEPHQAEMVLEQPQKRSLMEFPEGENDNSLNM